MADLSITAANVAMHATAATTELVTYGATVTQGQTVYKDSTDSNKCKLADCNGTAAVATVAGIVLTPGDSGDKGYIATLGPIDLGVTLTVGEIYVQSTTAGGIAPEADVSTTDDYVSVLGVASAADQLEVKLNNTGIQIP